MTAEENSSREPLIFTISSIIITSLLFFVDEGLYSFQWMTHWGSWIVFFMYMIPMLVAMLLFSGFVLKRINGTSRTLISVVLGSSISVFIVASLFLAF